jgi:5-hydroxyisourate hydrolase
MSSLSTHVLDTVSGRPASGVRVVLTQGDAQLGEGVTDADGRFRLPALEAGAYALTFHAGIISAPPGSNWPIRRFSMWCRSISVSVRLAITMCPC